MIGRSNIEGMDINNDPATIKKKSEVLNSIQEQINEKSHIKYDVHKKTKLRTWTKYMKIQLLLWITRFKGNLHGW